MDECDALKTELKQTQAALKASQRRVRQWEDRFRDATDPLTCRVRLGTWVGNLTDALTKADTTMPTLADAAAFADYEYRLVEQARVRLRNMLDHLDALRPGQVIEGD